MKVSITLKETFPVKPEVLYKAWLNSEEHTRMTGGEAVCTDHIGGDFTAWDGYISGKNKSLSPNKEIVQDWRTSEFEETQADSLLTLQFKEIPVGCELTLIHTEIPEGQSDYAQGWIDHYFIPMKDYFGA